MYRCGDVIACALAGLLLASTRASAQGTSAASIVGAVTDASGAVLPGVTVDATSPDLIEKVRTAVTDARGQYRIVELRPGTYTVTFTMPGFTTFKRAGIELTANFTATVNAELKIGQLEETVTVSSESPLVDIVNVTKQTVISKAQLDAVPTGKNLLSFYSLSPSAVTPTNAQDVGGSKGETTARASVHGSRQGDARMELDGMSFNWFEGEGSGRTFYVNALTAQEVVVDVASGSSAEYTSNGVVINLIPKDGGNRFSGTFFAAGTNHNLQANNMTPELAVMGAKSVSGTQSNYDVNAVIAGPIVKDKLWLMSAHRLWGRQERIANLYHDSVLNDPFFTPDYSQPGMPTEDFKSDNVRLTWQVNQKNKVNAMYEYQHNNPQNNFAYLNGGLASMESGNPYCYRDHLVMATWNDTATNHLLFEGGVLYLHTWANTFETACAGIPTGRLYRDTSLSFPFNGNGPTQSNTGEVPFKQRFSMTYLTGQHHVKVGINLEESLPAMTYSSRGPTPYTYTFRNGTPISLTEFVSPTIAGELKIRPDLAAFAQDQWMIKRFTFNVGIRYEYHHVYSDAIDTPAGPLMDARHFDMLDCIPCWHDIDPRFGMVWDVFGDGRTAVKASVGRYVGLTSYVMSRTFEPQAAAVQSTSRPWHDDNGDLIPNCDLRNTAANGECGPMANPNFGQIRLTTHPDPNWITGWGKRPYSWSGSISVDQQLMTGLAISAGFYRTTYGNFTVTHNNLTTPADYDPYCVTAPVDPRLPPGVSGQQICGLYDIKPSKFGQIDNTVTLASNYGNATEYYNGGDVSMLARLPHDIHLDGGWNVGNSISALTTFPGATTSKYSACFVVNSPQELYNCQTGNPYQHRFKINGSVPLPWDLQAAFNYQSLPGPNYDANYTFTSAQIAPSLGRPLAGGTPSVTINLVQPLSQFIDQRISQLDLRLSKRLKTQRGAVRLNMDMYNVTNASTVLWVNGTYGSNPATNQWLVPTSTLDGRMLKFSAQYDF